MTSSFGEFNTAAKMRDVIVKIVRAELERKRPLPRVGKVISINEGNLTAEVQFTGDTGTINARFGKSLIPQDTTAIVRVEGGPGNYYITEIINEAGGHELYEPIRVAYDAGELGGGGLGSDGVAPTDAITGLTVTPGIGSLIVEWDESTNPGFTRYGVYVAAAPGIVAGGPSLYSVTAGTSLIVTALPDGTPLANGTEYFVAVTAVDADGEGPISPEASSIPRLIEPIDFSPGSVNAEAIAAGAVTNVKIFDTAVDVTKLADGSVNAVKIIDLAVTNNKVATDTLTATQIAADAIAATELAANAVVAGKINANAVTATQLAANAVTAASVLANTMTANEIATNAITALEVASNAIIAGKVSTNAITAGTIAGDAVTSATIATGAVTADSIASGAVTADSIAAGAIVSDKIAANAIQAYQMQIGGFNLAPDPKMVYGGWSGLGNGWSYATISAASPLGSGRVFRLSRTAAGSSQYAYANETMNTLANRPSVSPGDQFHMTAYIRRQVSVATNGSIQSGIWFYDKDGAYITAAYDVEAATGFTTTAWHKFESDITAPAGAAYMWILPLYLNATVDAGLWDVTDVIVEKKVTSSLIVEGAIDGKTIKSSATGGDYVMLDAPNNRLAYYDNGLLTGYIASGLYTSGTYYLSLKSGSYSIGINGVNGVGIKGPLTTDSGMTITGGLDVQGGSTYHNWLTIGGYATVGSTLGVASAINANTSGSGGGLNDSSYNGGGTTTASVNNNGRIVRTSTKNMKKNLQLMTSEEAYSVIGLESYTGQFKQDEYDAFPDPRRYPFFVAEQGAEVGAELWVARQHDVERDKFTGAITKVTRNKQGKPIAFRTADITVAHNYIIKDLLNEISALKERVQELEAA